MSKKKFKISKENLGQLKEICKKNEVKRNNEGFNLQLDNLIFEAILKKDNPFSPSESYKKARELEDKEPLTIMREIASKEGIVLPDERIFESSEELRVYIMAKTLLNNTALEKMCRVFLPIYEKLPMTEFADKIGDFFKGVSEDK